MNRDVAMSSARTGVCGGNTLEAIKCDRPEELAVVPRQESYLPYAKPRSDWQELDMYAKHRQTFNPGT